MNDEPEPKRQKLNPVEICKKATDKFIQLLEVKQTEIKTKQDEITLNIKKVFEITDASVEIDDLEGDDDILDINFAGTIIRNFKRSFLTKASFGWNLFSCLFHKRWDVFHPRDREGRIYIDIEERWISPLLDYLRYSPCNHPFFSSPSFKIQIDNSMDACFDHFYTY
jgi:hypothetical protein